MPLSLLSLTLRRNVFIVKLSHFRVQKPGVCFSHKDNSDRLKTLDSGTNLVQPLFAASFCSGFRPMMMRCLLPSGCGPYSGRAGGGLFKQFCQLPFSGKPIINIVSVRAAAFKV
jgi:hypothetical protein